MSEVTAVSLRKPEPGRVLLIVKDDYAARQISEYISSLSYDYDADTYSCVPGSSGGSSTVNGSYYIVMSTVFFLNIHLNLR